METKKISFGFAKTKKQEKPAVVERREYIECVEEKAIKVIGGETVKDEAPLVIPMKPNTLITAERLKEIAEKVESTLDEPVVPVKNETVEEIPPENETLEQMATRELLQEAKQQKVVEPSSLFVPIPAKPVMDGERESTLDDYESVPIQEFGLAMLRGMGWTPGKEQSKYKQPALRPKGLGLGADKVVKDNQKKKTSKDMEEDLAIIKGSYVKVTTGKYNGCYGKIVSLDEDNGRVMVEIVVKKETVNLSEFMVQVVTKSEFDKLSKLINADSYAEYKKNESGATRIPKHQDSTDSRGSTSKHKSNEGSNRDHARDKRREVRDGDSYSNGRGKDIEDRLNNHRSRNNSTSDEEVSHRNKLKDSKKNSSDESVNSDADKKRHKRNKRHSSITSSDSSGADRRKHKNKSNKRSKQKRDIDKKRKGKKKKRDRDRSPNYRKHKK